MRYAKVVRRGLTIAVGMGMVCSAWLLAAAPQISSAKRRPRQAARSAPAITAKMRAAAAEKVAEELNAPPDGVLSQPAALVPAFELLSRLGPGQSGASLHILHFGDSHTAADEWTGALRELLKQRFGDGGPGFSLAGRPFLGYRRLDAHEGALTTLWHADGFRAPAGDGYYGLGGISITATRPAQSVFLDADCALLEIHYLQQPGGGDVAVYQDGQRLDEFSTGGELGPGVARYTPPPGMHRFLLKTVDARPVRLFGWAADKQSGLTYEALGINGAEAGVILRWNENMLSTYLRRRDPGLVVLSYGTNEATDPNWTPDTYQAMYASVLARLRAALPGASILAIGPGDRWSRTGGAWRVVNGIDGIIAAQQAACRAAGVAYWDARERMGGKGAMRDWVYAGLGQPDYVHFTAAGYRRLADVLYQDLMHQYELYEQAKQNH